MIAIISDIHGNLAALEAVLSKLNDLNIKDIICLGDICGYYSKVNECCLLVRKYCKICIQGNHDWYIVNNRNCPRSNSANDCLEFQRKVITKDNLNWLSTLSPQGEYQNLKMAHGGWKDPLDEYLVPSEEYFNDLKGDYFTSGHSHFSQIWKSKTKSYSNPGSVGQPRDGDWRASFATFDGRNFEIIKVEYNFKKTQEEMIKNGFDKYYSVNLEHGLMIGKKVEAPK